MDFSTSFIPHLDVLDFIRVTFDNSGAVELGSLWDLNDWADTAGATPTGTELVWDGTKGDAFKLNNEEMRLLSVELDLDKMETRFVARET